MTIDSILRRLVKEATPTKAQKNRVRDRITQSVGTPIDATSLSSLTPSAGVKARVWERVLARIEAPTGDALLEKIKGLLTPSNDQRSSIANVMFDMLQTKPAQQTWSFGLFKWVSALTVIAIVVGMSPGLFLISPTLAGTDVRLVPTQGRVAVSIGGLWQEVEGELVLEPGMRIRTHGEGQASILFHDDGVLRLGEETIIALHDTTEHLEPAPEAVPSASLIEGTLWVQGLIPSNSRGLTVAVPNGYVTVNEGSLSLSTNDEDNVDVAVWDRRATAVHNGARTVLIAGETTELRDDDVLLVKNVDEEQFHDQWQKQNLARDAVHRRHIAHLQNERLASRAGILPTSSFYSVKRVAEEVDVLLSFSEEARIQKRLDQAQSRLSEAAAFIANGERENASSSLDEFKGAYLKLTSGTGGDTIAHFLIKQSVSEAQAGLAAALPGDDSYALKRMVIETAADLPSDIVDVNSINQVLFADALDQLLTAADTQDMSQVREKWMAFQPHLNMLESDESDLEPELVKEARSSLERVAVMVEDNEDLNDNIDPELRDDLLAFLPPESEAPVVQMNAEEVRGVVADMVDRIYVYKMPRSRNNQLRVEVSAIQGHEEEGRFLRELYQQLPEDSQLNELVRKEIVRLRWERAAENTVAQKQPVDIEQSTNI